MVDHFAIIDIGSNSIRLVLHEINEKGFHKEVENFKIAARLSFYLSNEKILSEEGMSKLIFSLRKFAEIIHPYNNVIIKCVATAAIRQAKNQEEIIQMVKTHTSFQIEVLSEFEEAYYGFFAIIHSTSIKDGISIDIGGGSTEITLFKNQKLIQYHSFPFGSITLKKKFIRSNDPTNEELNELRDFLINQFKSIGWIINKNLPVIGIGGSASDLSLIHQKTINYPLGGLHQYEIKTIDFHETVEKLISKSFKKRQQIDGLSKDRADIIIPAAEAIRSLILVTQSDSFITSNKGLRDGILFDHLFAHLNIEHIDNSALYNINLLTNRFMITQWRIDYLKQNVHDIILQLKLYEPIPLTEKDEQLLQLSASAVYLGDFISREASIEHTFYIITHLSIDGLTHLDRLTLALISSFKSRKYLEKLSVPFQSHFPQLNLQNIEYLGALLKFAYSLNRTKQEIISKVQINECDKNTITFQFYFSTASAYFEYTQAEKNKKHLEKVLNKKIQLQFTQEI